MRMRSRAAMLMAGVAATTVLAGCGTHHAASSPDTPTTVEKHSPAPAARTMRFALADATAGPVTVKVPDTPIATVPTDEAGLSLQLFVAQRVDPQTVEVIFALRATTGLNVPQETAIEESLSANDAGGNNPTVSAVALFDPAAMKEYLTFMVKPTVDTTCLCSQVDTQSLANPPESAYYAALIAAPPAADNTVSFVTGLGTIADVSLSGS